MTDFSSHISFTEAGWNLPIDRRSPAKKAKKHTQVSSSSAFDSSTDADVRGGGELVRALDDKCSRGPSAQQFFEGPTVASV